MTSTMLNSDQVVTRDMLIAGEAVLSNSGYRSCDVEFESSFEIVKRIFRAMLDAQHDEARPGSAAAPDG